MFFIPFIFTKKTRYNSISKIFVYFITYFFPVLIVAFLENFATGISLHGFFIPFTLSFISYVNMYEIGYIWNECETIKKEENPTKRLTEKNLGFYEKRKIIIYIERFVITIILNFVLSFFISRKSLILFSSAEFLSLTVFFIYNNVRGKITQFIYLFLSILKYTSVLFCFSENLSASVIIAAIFVFPIVRTIEYKAHYGTDSDINLFFRKYIIHYDISKITVFRVWATLILLVLSIILKLFNICNWIPVICCSYIFIYRFALFVAVKCGAKFKGYLKTDTNNA